MKNKQLNANQRGSALLLTLGVLSLALILAMAFAFSSRSSRLIAKVNADMIKAKLLAQSGLTRLTAAMYHDTKATPGFYIARKTDNLTFTGTIANSNASVGFLSMGADTSAEPENSLINTLKRNCDYVDTLSSIDATFLPAGFQTVVSDGKIIGRIGFVMLEESGKIDLNQALNLRLTGNNMPFVQAGQLRIDSGTNTFSAATDFYYNILGGYLPGIEVAESNTLRTGLHMQEIRVAAAPYLSALPATSVTTRKAQWMSYAHLLNSTKYTSPTTFDNDILHYTFFSGEEPEAFYDASFPDTNFQRERHRFDITGYEWRNNTLGSYYGGGGHPHPPSSGWQHPTEAGTANAANYARNLASALKQAAQQFWDITTPGIPNTVKRINHPGFPGSFSGIPWLGTLTPATARPQAAANLVDYCDSDSWATIPAGVTWTSTTEPAYCGNEKVPYFNEVALEVVAEKAVTAIPDYTFRLRIVPSVELVNIFSESLDSGAFQLRLIGTYQLTGMAAAVSFDKTVTFSSQNIAAMSYGTDALLATDAATVVHTLTQGSDIPDAEYSLTITQIILVAGTAGNNNQISDFGFWQGGVSTTVIPDLLGDTQYASLEVDDPRLNHLSNSWNWHNGSPEFSSTPPNNTLGTDNSNFNPQNDGTNTAMDIETISAIAPGSTFSTAFIRNAPMENLWELGAIHRGAPWQTLNLRSFSTGGDYAGGDAMILDQVKIGPVKFSRGKYNPNAINPAVCQELLFGINPIAPDVLSYDVPTWGGAAPLPDKNDWHSPSEFRGQAANVFATLGGTTDQAREAWIGRTANLLSTRNECYTIIVLAQAMQELPSDIDTETKFNAIKASVINPTVYKVSGTDRYCSILATQVLMAHVVRDAWRNTYQIVQQRYLE